MVYVINKEGQTLMPTETVSCKHIRLIDARKTLIIEKRVQGAS